MKSFSALLLIFLFIFQQVTAQIIDDFSDGDFTTNPPWHGSTGNFIVNSSAQLQLSTDSAGTSWLSTAFDVSSNQNVVWAFYLKQSFAPSGANFSRFYLMSDQADLSGPLNGYYLQFGEPGAADAVELFRQTGTVSASVCRSSSGAIASAFAVSVRVTRSNLGEWQMLIAYNEQTGVVEASGIDKTHELSSFSGLLCTYTITNGTRFFLDNIHFSRANAPDLNAPKPVTVEARTPQKLQVAFSERLELSSAEDPLNYFLSALSKNPLMAELQPDQQTVLLTFADAIENGREAILHLENVRDLVGNAMSPQDFPFLFFLEAPLTYRDIIINEIFADPHPELGLPPAEFVELYNRSGNPIQLRGWTFSDGTSTAVLPDFILLPENFVIVCAATDVEEYGSFGTAIPVNTLPTLNNSGDHLSLVNQSNMVVDSVSYDVTWYKDEDKRLGGWTLERIDPENSCGIRSNWTASMDPAGGTPGKSNSVHQSIPDLSGPVLTQIIQLSDSQLELVFNEKLSGTEPDISDFIIEPPVSILDVSFSDATLSTILLDLASVVDSTVAYRISALNISDCPGNLIEPGDGVQYLNKDETVPTVTGVQVVSSIEISVMFSELVSSASSEVLGHYEVEGMQGLATAGLNVDGLTVKLTFASPLTNGKQQTLRIRDVVDLAGNRMRDTLLTFLYYQPSPVSFKDIVFSEIFADPSPPVELPEAEYIELYNRSTNPIDLAGWILSDESTSAPLGHFILLPDEYVIATNAPEEFAAFGRVLPVSLPSLNNSRDIVKLTDREANTIDSVEYVSKWHNNETSDGGWSLELIDPDNICAGPGNWTVSESHSGGTPGKENSVKASLQDNTGPVLLSAVAPDSMSVTLTFSEALDNQVPSPEHFDLQPQTEMINVRFTNAMLASVTIDFATPLDHGKLYRITVHDIYDCAGNVVQEDHSTVVLILPEKPAKGDVVINELLFNPMPQGVDFVEVYNRSPKAIDLKDWTLASADSDKGEKISESQSVMFPGEYRVFTENTNKLKGEYVASHEETFRETTLPALNDESGSVILRDGTGLTIDSVFYSDDYHSAFVKDAEGISLERISVASEEAGAGSNWLSASAQVGFATPGYANSNARTEIVSEGSVTIEPEVIQPGRNASFALISYRFDRGDFIANVKIFDQQGRPVRQIAANALLGTEGFFRWDGDLDNGWAAAIGYYIVWFEVFDSEGMVTVFRKRLALF